MTKVLEGTWEEVAAYAPNWGEKRLRVAVDVLDAPDEDDPEDEAEQERLRAAIMEVVETVAGLPEDVGRNHKKYFARVMDEKYKPDPAQSGGKS